MSTHFVCQACMDNKPNEELTLVAGNPLCRICFIRGIQPQFIAALQNEIHHPVTYGGTTLDINDFASFFTPEFLASYHTKLQEYAVPVTDRLYCNNAPGFTLQVCERFLGNRAAEKEAGNAAITCPACSTSQRGVYSCVECFESFSGDITGHTCSDEDPDDAFRGLTRGLHYQVCPNTSCQVKIQLSEACNHMTCQMCRTEFCYICGDLYTQDHFDVTPERVQPCPMYGRLGDRQETAPDEPRDPETIDEVEDNMAGYAFLIEHMHGARFLASEALRLYTNESLLEVIEPQNRHYRWPPIRQLLEQEPPVPFNQFEWLLRQVRIGHVIRDHFPVLRTVWIHSRQLNRVRDRILAEGRAFPAMDELIDLLQHELPVVYTLHQQVPQLRVHPLFVSVLPGHREAYERILRVARSIGEEGFGERIAALMRSRRQSGAGTYHYDLQPTGDYLNSLEMWDRLDATDYSDVRFILDVYISAWNGMPERLQYAVNMPWETRVRVPEPL